MKTTDRRSNREKYRDAFQVLHTSAQIRMEEIEMRQSRKRITARFAAKAGAVCCALLLCTGAVFAAAHFLSPSQVAEEIGDPQLAAAFQSEDAVLLQETQHFDRYDVTLLGMVSGADLSRQKVEAGDGEFRADRTYLALAIQRTDGGELGDDESFFATPLIDGYGPRDVNIATLVGGYSAIYSDDMKSEYFISDMDNIEPFADHRIQFAVADGGFETILEADRVGEEPDESRQGGDALQSDSDMEQAYRYDTKAGAYSRNASYGGAVNALFDLPLDASKADPKKAEELVRQR